MYLRVLLVQAYKEMVTVHDFSNCREQRVHSLRPSDVYMRKKTALSLVQIMACRLFGGKPLSEPMMAVYEINLEEHISMKFNLKIKSFHSRKYLKMSSTKWRPFCLGLIVLRIHSQARLCVCLPLETGRTGKHALDHIWLVWRFPGLRFVNIYPIVARNSVRSRV